MVTGAEFNQFVHPRQRPRFVLALAFSLLLAPLLLALGVFLTITLIIPLLALIFWIASRVAFAHMLGNSILVSQYNYPRIQALVEEVKVALKYDKPVYVFVYEQGDFNAMMRRFFFRRAIFLNSEVVERGVSDDEVRWIVGRFVGYWRAQRRSGVWGALIRVAQRLLIFNLFILPYERATVYTGDRLALATIGGDIATAISAMQKLLVGRELGYSLNPTGIVDQHRKVKGSLFAFLARLSSAYPHQTARYVDLIGFAHKTYPGQFEHFQNANPDLPQDILKLGS